VSQHDLVEDEAGQGAARSHGGKAPEVGDKTTLVTETVESDVRRTRVARWQLLLARGLAILGLLAFWEFASGRLVSEMFVSRPTAIFAAIIDGFLNRDLIWHAQATALEAVLGFLIGSISGVVLALLLTVLKRVYDVVEPIIMAIYSIPKIALAPLFIVWFGLGISSKVAIAGFMVFFIVFINSVAALSQTNPRVVQISRMMGATKTELLWRIRLPSAAPYILTSLKVVVPIAMIGAVVGEFISSQRGLGFWITRATLGFNTASAFAGILVLMVVVMMMTGIVTWADKNLLPWRKDQDRS
jgi:NitT/TauT family transport system permease protein